MITAAEERLVAQHAYVPEHLPGYVTAISPGEPYLLEDHVWYRGRDDIVFIGYPLRSPFDEMGMKKALEAVRSRFAPKSLTVVAPSVSVLGEACRARGSDRYFRIDLSSLRLAKKVEGMVRRASRELRVEEAARLEAEHVRLISEFLDSRPAAEGTRYIFERVPAYVSSVSTARVFAARDPSGNLVAFDVAEFGARDYAFYLFNFASRKHYVPGASDLLLHELLEAARLEGKRFVNLGLGINEGVARFKRKWGAVPFLDYECCRFHSGRPTVLDVLLGKR